MLKHLEQLRFKDAETLLRTGIPERRNGAIYLAGYGVECALKAKICVDRGDYQLDSKFFHHDLVRLATETCKWKLMSLKKDAWYGRLFYLQTMWFVEMRYEVRSHDKEKVRQFIEKAKEFTKWLSE